MLRGLENDGRDKSYKYIYRISRIELIQFDISIILVYKALFSERLLLYSLEIALL